jgi:hypothetical protein
MQLTQPEAQAASRLPLSPLSKTTSALTFGIALLLIYLVAVVLGKPFPPLIIMIVVSLAVSGMVVKGWRWAPAVASVYSLLFLGMNLPMMTHILTDPVDSEFPLTFSMIALAAACIPIGIAAAVQNYRAGERTGPRWLSGALGALVGLCAGAVLIGAIPRPGMVTGIAPGVMNGLPSLAVTGGKFAQQEIRVKSGQTVVLQLTNNDPAAHSFDVDELNIHTPMPSGETALAIFRATTPGTYTFYCAPHYNKATGKGMKGILVVEP